MELSKFYITQQIFIEQKLITLKKIGSSDDGWSDYFVDESNDVEWQLTCYNSEYHGGGLRVLKRLPPPAVEDLIKISLTSDDIDEVTGAALELRDRETYKKEEFRKDLITELLLLNPTTLSAFDKNRLKTIIYESSLFDPTNRREILGKPWNEIQKDAEIYRSISEQAKSILKKLE
jgi:hypothetical protein